MIPLGLLTGYMPPDQLRPEFSRFECGQLDASEFVAAGSTASRDYGVIVATLAYRYHLPVRRSA